MFNSVSKGITFTVVLCVFMWVVYKFISVFYREGFESNPHDFEENIKNGKKLVLFYATWCGHCNEMKQYWDDASNTVNNDKHIKMVKINVGDEKNPKHKRIAEKYNISGFPTILLFDSGLKKYAYEGNRTKNDFIEYCKTHV